MAGKIRAFVACQNKYCAMDQTFPLDMVRNLHVSPICEDCYYEEGHDLPWADLEEVKLSDLFK
jgi:hypothetical protein